MNTAQPASRRWFLAGGAAVLLGGGGGAAAALLRDEKPAPPPVAPPELLAAAAAERRLIADLDATTGGTPAVRRVIVSARADHAAHLAALTRLLAGYRRTAATRPGAVRGTPRTRAELRAAEERAAAAAAAHAATLPGGLAALLASISACEASHAELLG
jgi:hypothetical protein